jgi:hypothetical protein
MMSGEGVITARRVPSGRVCLYFKACFSGVPKGPGEQVCMSMRGTCACRGFPKDQLLPCNGANVGGVEVLSTRYVTG